MMTNIKELENLHRQASEQAIKIHNALDVPYVTMRGNQAVEMLHGEVIRVIEENIYKPSSHSVKNP